jgi:exodeoxyribonuclease (lambda-induced)
MANSPTFRSNEWYQARIGKITASFMYLLMAKPADGSSGWSKSALNYINDLALQLHLKEYFVHPDCDATRWGINNEAEALSEFIKQTGFSQKSSGFILHPLNKEVGATPDACIIEEARSKEIIIAQIKCPYNSDYHLKYRFKITDNHSLRKCKSEYFWQIQTELWVTSAKYCYFISYDPRLLKSERLHFAEILRDEEAIEQLSITTKEAIKQRDKIIDELKSGKMRFNPGLIRH